MCSLIKQSINRNQATMYRISQVCVDFDETITFKDTLEPLLFKSVIDKFSNDIEAKETRIKLWHNLVNQYMEELNIWKTNELVKISTSSEVYIYIATLSII